MDQDVGVAQDDGKAVELYTKAADQKHARASASSGTCMNTGLTGITHI